MAEELRNDVINFVKSYCKKHGTVPSVRLIIKHCKTYTNQLYEEFPGRLPEICREAEVSEPTERITKMHGVSETKRNEKNTTSASEREFQRFKNDLQITADQAKLNKNGFIEHVKKILPYLEEEISGKFERIKSCYGISEEKALEDAFLLSKPYIEIRKACLIQGKPVPKFEDYVRDVLRYWMKNSARTYGSVVRSDRCVLHNSTFILRASNGKHVVCCDHGSYEGYEEHKIKCEICGKRFILVEKEELLRCPACSFTIRFEPTLEHKPIIKPGRYIDPEYGPWQLEWYADLDNDRAFRLALHPERRRREDYWRIGPLPLWDAIHCYQCLGSRSESDMLMLLQS